ncbi:DUF1003 domain-containing protein [Alicyclobacillaceae bacterium I2511]|nr:DUF1003 domain-containing protein [Alicyclobacillaceae bacterium I2511]
MKSGASSKNGADGASLFQGFDIKMQKDDIQRVDAIVDNYESRIVDRLNDTYIRETRWSDRLADRIAAFGGSWAFISIFSVFLFLWMTWNVVSFTPHFDKPPFILLNLILSFVAAFQAPVILMSQNRQASRDKHESIIDFAINYKAEQEVDDMQGHLHRIEAELAEIRNALAVLAGPNQVQPNNGD